MARRRCSRLVLGLACGVALLGLPGAGSGAGDAGGRGVEILVSAAAPSGARVTEVELRRSVEVMRARLDRLGDRGSVSRAAGSRQIEIRLDGLSGAAASAQARTITATARVGFYDLTASLLAPSIDADQDPVATTSLAGLLTQAGSLRHGAASAFYLVDARTRRTLAGPTDTLAQLRTGPDGTLPPGTRVLRVPARSMVVSCGAATAVACPGLSAPPGVGATYYYLFKHGAYPDDAESPYPQLSGEDLLPGGTRQRVDPASGSPVVSIHFTASGERRFHELTREESQRGQALGYMQSFAIVVDGRLYSFPAIDYRQYPDGIDASGGAEITGLRSLAEARRLALVVGTGTLPLAFVTRSERAFG